MKTFFLIFAAAFLLSCSSGSLHDSRDGKTYKTVKIGSQTWMAENLNFDASGSRCYDNDPGNCQRYGRLYNWNTALTVCPSGWRLPTDAEWTVLTDHAGSNAGTKLKASSGWSSDNGTNDFGFSALPGGIGSSSGSFYFVGDSGFWWSATEVNASYAWSRSMSYDFSGAGRNGFIKSDLLSVRCLQD
ncbi:MAG: fibrobacter succinogenes major paralogous domain-containing protein [Fibromonadaceae bacterium]|nr:fibrobacter succinogenes major paralogous domain-containing protein [Fibromonadaceae bacterium]